MSTKTDEERVAALAAKVAQDKKTAEDAQLWHLKIRHDFVRCTRQLFDEIKRLADRINLRWTELDEGIRVSDATARDHFQVPGPLEVHHPRGRLRLAPAQKFEQNALPPAYSGLELRMPDEKMAEIFYSEQSRTLVFFHGEEVKAIDLVAKLTG